MLALAAVAILVAACGGSATSDSPADGSATPSVVAPTESASSSGGDASVEPSEAPSDEPSAEPSEAPSETPSEEPTQGPSGTPSLQPSPSGGSAGLCAGNADNRDFYASVAAAVDWTVYCPVLPSGWFVDSGSYRLAGGGRMIIGYKGPGGRHIQLSEGSFCADGSGCVPDGTDAGQATFGSETGDLVSTSDGGYALVVARGAQPSWLLVGSGMDEAAFRQIAANLIVVPG